VRRAGDVVGGYRLGAKIGCGSFAVVHEAVDIARGLPVAVKLLHVGGAAADGLAREAALLARLDHPNVIALINHGIDDGMPFVVLERLHGVTLAERLACAPMPVAAALSIGVAVARGLSHAHGLSIVHADLKPANVFLCDDGAVKLLDFGLAALNPAVGVPANDSSGGTPAYMAPERWNGARPSYASDVFALGTLIYEMLHGQRPRRDQPLALDGPALTPPLAALIARALDPVPERRFADGRELGDALVAAQRLTRDPQRCAIPAAKCKPHAIHRHSSSITRAATGLRWSGPLRESVMSNSIQQKVQAVR
jgi:serine/threonine protein kinase